MAESAPATRRVREDYLPTWGKFAGVTVLTMFPFAFPPVRDLIYLPDGGVMSRPRWGLVADLANILQARAHIIVGTPDANTATDAYNALIKSWEEKPGIIVLAGDGSGAQLATELKETNQLSPRPDFTETLPKYMLNPFLPKTGAAKREISKQVWGE